MLNKLREKLVKAHCQPRELRGRLASHFVSTFVSDVVVKRGAQRIREPLGVLDHFIESFVALFDQRIVLFDLRVFLVDIELEPLLLSLKLHDLLVEMRHLHPLLHDFCIYLVAPISQFIHLSF